MASVYISRMIEAQATAVWAIIRDFNALPDWHPLIVDSRIEAGLASDQVGCIRAFQLTDGGRIREQLLALSDFDFSSSYSILDSPMPLQNYVATLKVTPVTETNTAFVEWQADFDCAASDRDDLIKSIGEDVFAAGLQALQARLQ